MKKASLIVHQNYVEDVIKNLHETGIMEIIDISKEEPETLEGIEKVATHPDAEACTLYELRLSRLIGILNKLKPKKSGLKALLHPDLPEIRPVEDRPLDEIYSYAEGILEEIEKKILGREQKLQALNEKIEIINQDLNQLELIKDFEFDISHIGESDYVIVKVGKTLDLESLKAEIGTLEKSVIYSKQFGTDKKIEWVVLIGAHILEKDKLEKICREKISEFSFEVSSGPPKELLKSLKDVKKEINKEKKKIASDLRIFAQEQLDDLLALKEEIQLERIRKEVPKNFAKTKSTYILKGWILEKDEKTLQESLSNVSKDHILFNFKTPSANPDNPPTYIKTPRWAGGFKSLLGMFSLPKYNEVNPTIIMGIFFVLFFGIMLGDAGYGIVILALSLYGYIKLSKHSELIRDWSFMGIFMGLITSIVGFLTNSFFGDLIPRFFYSNPDAPLYSLDVFGIHLPANPIKDPLTILAIALIFGLAHLNVGIILGIYQAYKRKNYKKMLTERFCFIPLQIGGGMLIGYFILGWYLPDFLFSVAGILVIIGIIQLFIASGPIGFFAITGYIGDWLSYARLLALGLATAGMALAFNIVSELLKDMIPIQIIGVIIMIFLLIIMHLVNLGLQALGAGVHSLRLQYVEFFNRFYEGGGHEFAPFKIDRKYTKNNEEKID